ncbi:MAG: HAD-like domain-containing protein [Monoraphidium minutum]|nr:MAG: HAD-like domain-containing protein [Monoraphidium minutum]
MSEPPQPPPLPTHGKRPKAIVLDVNGTLFPPSAAGAAFTDLGLDAARVDEFFAATLRDGFAAHVAGGGGGGAFVTFAQVGAAHLGDMLRAAGDSSTDPDAAMRQVAAAWAAADIYPDIAPALKRIKAAGIQVAALTNGTAGGIATRLVERAGLAGVVDPLLDVQMAQAWKPDARAYRFATDRLGVPQHDVLMVAAHPWDVNGALAAGLRGVYVRRAGGGAFPAFLRRPEAVVGDFGELAERLLALE